MGHLKYFFILNLLMVMYTSNVGAAASGADADNNISLKYGPAGRIITFTRVEVPESPDGGAGGVKKLSKEVDESSVPASRGGGASGGGSFSSDKSDKDESSGKKDELSALEAVTSLGDIKIPGSGYVYTRLGGTGTMTTTGEIFVRFDADLPEDDIRKIISPLSLRITETCGGNEFIVISTRLQDPLVMAKRLQETARVLLAEPDMSMKLVACITRYTNR